MLFNTPLYLPHLDYDGVLFMGLKRITPKDWIETNSNEGLAQSLAHKQHEYHQDKQRVFQALDSSIPAQQELSELLRSHLKHDHGQIHIIPTEKHPLYQASTWIADDLLIMQKEQQQGAYHLTAASLCSPSHWNLAEKFNQPIRFIHDPIPDFHTVLSDKVDRLFDRLKPEFIMQRYNWSLQADTVLAQYPDRAKTPVDSDTPLYYRCERQSIRRLPKTDAIAFTVRVYIYPLERLWDVEGAMAKLFESIDTLPDALLAYKDFARYSGALAKYQDKV